MTREEEIMEASQNETKKFSNFLVSAPVFRMGARWADRTMIDKACEWLKEEYPKAAAYYEHPDSFIDQFRKAMKGD